MLHSRPCTFNFWTNFWIHFSYKHSAQTPRKTVCIVDDVTALHSTVRYEEMLLSSRCLETDCITPLFYCCVLCYLATAVFVAQQLLHGVNTPHYFSHFDVIIFSHSRPYVFTVFIGCKISAFGLCAETLEQFHRTQRVKPKVEITH
jgi:hypothetical protein